MLLFKHKKIILITIFWLFLFFILFGSSILAAGIEFKPNVTVPGSEFKANVDSQVSGTLLGRYIKAWYKFGVGIAGILAVLMIAYGGVVWLFSGGASEKIGHAKELITGAVIGLVLALGSYLILNTISPKLISLDLNVNEISKEALSGSLCRNVSLDEEFETETSKCLDCFECIEGCDEKDESKLTTQCGGKYQIPGQSGVCYGVMGCDAGTVCGKYWSNAGNTACWNPEAYCQSMYDDTTSLYGLSDDQSSCDWAMSQLAGSGNTGRCLWVDHNAFLEWNGEVMSFAAAIVAGRDPTQVRGASDDGCYYFSVSNITASCTKDNNQVINNCADYNLAMGRLPAFHGGQGSISNRIRKSFCLSDTCSLLRLNNLSCHWSDQNGCY